MEDAPLPDERLDLNESALNQIIDRHCDTSNNTANAKKTSKYFRFVAVDREERLRIIHDEKYTDGDPNELTFIHIGKCGGYTVADALAVSLVVKKRFSSVKRIHIRPPHYQKRAQYLFVLRNPVDRVVSAFAWRYQQVVVSKAQEFQFAGEYEVLKKYETLNNLAEKLVSDGEFCMNTVRDALKIVHFSQDIAYYLQTLIPLMRKKQIFSVLTQENLNEEIYEKLEVQHPTHQNNNKTDDSTNKIKLSREARRNIKLFFAHDYECIRALNSLYPLGSKTMQKLMR